MERLRIASLQYFIRPVQTFDQFRDQVQALVETAADYKAQLLVFPEYFTVQLLTLGNVKRPIREQVRDLAHQADRFSTLMADLARQHGLYIVAGTIPVVENGSDHVYNESFFFSPSGMRGVQGKLHMTRFEKEEWKVSPRSKFRVFETTFGRVAITICYDVEFPEIAERRGVKARISSWSPVALTTAKGFSGCAIARKPAPSKTRCMSSNHRPWDHSQWCRR